MGGHGAQSGPRCIIHGMEIKRSPELEAIVRRIGDAFAKADLMSLANTTIEDPSLLVILSGDEDWLEGPDVVRILRDRSEVMEIDAIEFDRLEAYEAGGFGWFASSMIVTDIGGESRAFRQSGILSHYAYVRKSN